jgi:stage V sporulation protein B
MHEEENLGTSTARGAYHLFLGNTSSTLMLAVSSIIVGRVLGPAGYGLYAVALIVPPFLFNATRLGLDSAATRYAARLRSEGRAREAVSFVYAMLIIEIGIAMAFTLVFVSLSGAIATGLLKRPELAQFVLPLAMVSVLGQAAYTVTSSGLMGLGRFDRAGILQGIQGLARLAVSAGLVLLGFGVAGAVAGYTFAFFVSGAIGIALILRESGAALPEGMKADAQAGVRYGFPVYLGVLASGFVAPAINTVLALTVSNAQIGGYAAASTFNSLIALFTYPITTALFPLFSRSVEDPASLARTYRTAVWFSALLVLPITSFIIVFSSPLMATFYGRAYSFGSGYLALFAAITLFAGLGNLAWGAMLNGIGHTKDALTTTAIASGVSVVSAVSLIGSIGVIGAIVGQIAGAGVSLVVGSLMVRRRLGVGLGLASVWKIYAASAVSGAACYPISFLVKLSQISLVAGFAVFVVVFIPVLALLKAMNQEEVAALRGYFRFSSVVSTPLDWAIHYYDLVARARSTYGQADNVN